jgi:lysyl-tRNA synthetase class 2
MDYSATLIPVESSAIRAIGYAGSTLTVAFHTGRVYDHPNVPWSIFADFLRASSKGAFYNRRIRGRYP